MNADTNSSKNGSKTKYSVQYLDQQTANCVKRTALLEHLTVFLSQVWQSPYQKVSDTQQYSTVYIQIQNLFTVVECE